VALGQLEEPEAAFALDDHIQPSVVELLDHLDDRRLGSDVAHAFVVGEHEPERAVAVEALADELLVAGLEHVERSLLARHEHEREWEESDLIHAESVVALGLLRARRRSLPSRDRGSRPL
jgi:hypothetical protein